MDKAMMNFIRAYKFNPKTDIKELEEAITDSMSKTSICVITVEDVIFKSMNLVIDMTNSTNIEVIDASTEIEPYIGGPSIADNNKNQILIEEIFNNEKKSHIAQMDLNSKFIAIYNFKKSWHPSMVSLLVNKFVSYNPAMIFIHSVDMYNCFSQVYVESLPPYKKVLQFPHTNRYTQHEIVSSNF